MAVAKVVAMGIGAVAVTVAVAVAVAVAVVVSITLACGGQLALPHCCHSHVRCTTASRPWQPQN